MKVYKCFAILFCISFCFGCSLFFTAEDELPIEDWVVTGVRYNSTSNNMRINIEGCDDISSDEFYWDFEGKEELLFIYLTSISDRNFSKEGVSEASYGPYIYIDGITPHLVEGMDTEMLFDTETYFYKESYSPYGTHIVAKCRFITPSVTIEYIE